MYETNERLADYVTPTPAGAQDKSAPRNGAAPASGWRAVLDLAKAAAPALASLATLTAAPAIRRVAGAGRSASAVCPVCKRRIYLHLRAACTSAPVPPAPKQWDAPLIRFADLWDTTRSRRDAASANGRWAALALLAALLLLPGCAHSPFYVSGIEARASVTDTSKDGSVFLHISPREGGLAK